MRDRDLVRLYWPVELRPAFDALMGIDDVMGEIVASSTQPTLGAIRLAWWRDALIRLDTNAAPPEPRLQAVANELLRRGVSGHQLSGIEAGWAAMLDEFPDDDDLAARGSALFAGGARLLGGDEGQATEAGRAFALADARRRGVTEHQSRPLSLRIAAALRPLTALTVLARRDPREPEATPGRAWALLRHRFTGRIS